MWGARTPFALGVGFVAGFATVVQFMAHLSTWLVNENGAANGLGLFVLIMSLVAVAASVRCVARVPQKTCATDNRGCCVQVVFVAVANRAASARAARSSDFATLNIAATLNSLAPDVGLRWRHVSKLDGRKVGVQCKACGVMGNL